MTPLPPIVVGPLSNLNKTVEVSGQITGATVTVRANGTTIAKGTATSANQVFPLVSGASLSAGQSVTARQEVNGVSSADSPHPVVVQQAPAHLGHVVFTFADLPVHRDRGNRWGRPGRQSRGRRPAWRDLHREGRHPIAQRVGRRDARRPHRNRRHPGGPPGRRRLGRPIHPGSPHPSRSTRAFPR